MKKKILLSVAITLFVSILYIGNVSAAEYENYFGLSMTNEQYNNLLNLGFSEDEIYYMDEETFNNNKDVSATLVAKNEKYYKSIYTDLNGESHSVEITKEEYENQGSMNARGTVSTEYKTMVTVISQLTNKFRYKVSVSWKQMPSTKSYDIIGIGFADDVYISSSVYFNYYHCNSSGDCVTDTLYYNKKKLSTGGSAVYKIPSTVRALSANLYYDVSKNDSSDTITELTMYGDYAHATRTVTSSQYTDYTINRYGISLGSGVSYYDAIPTAVSSWGGTW